MLFDKERKEKKKEKKFAGDGCLNGLQKCGALLSCANDSAFLLRRLAELVMEQQKTGMLKCTSHGHC